MGESKRQLKVAKQLLKDLSEIIRLKLSDNFKNTLITITRVHVSPDLSVARIYISLLTTIDPKMIIKEIIDKKSQIRKILGNRIGKQVRIIPELIFLEDHGAKHASEIDDILSDLDIPPQSE
jgi:ribosome-binding factor A